MRRTQVRAGVKFDSNGTGWHFDGDIVGGASDLTRLSTICELTIGPSSVSMHIELFQVTSADVMEAVNPLFQEAVDLVCALCDESPVETIKFRGRTYVPVLYPFSA